MHNIHVAQTEISRVRQFEDIQTVKTSGRYVNYLLKVHNSLHSEKQFHKLHKGTCRIVRKSKIYR